MVVTSIEEVRRPVLSRNRQSIIGVALSMLIVVAWLAVHISSIFFIPWSTMPFAVPFVILLQCWLYVGLFIIGHDCMHGSVAPGHGRINRVLGTVVLFLYAGFPFEMLNANHHAHHRHSGTGDDPDFDDRHPHGFWRWYAKFFLEYLTWRQPVVIGSVICTYYFIFGAPIEHIVVFVALPALLSSLQLFTFGTYLPHRPQAGSFADGHRARSNDYNALLSLLTCYHFGYHHEHHLRPKEPWWRLPRTRSTLSRINPPPNDIRTT